MPLRKLFVFLFEAAIAGLAFAFVLLLLFRPETFETRPTVLITEAPAPALEDGEGGGAVSYAHAVQIAAPAVVNIYTTKVVTQRSPLLEDPFFRRFFGQDPAVPRQRMESSLGSGVIVSAQGYLLTNNHVIEGADEIQVALNDGRSASALVVGSDPETDLALLKADFDSVPHITFTQADNLRVGDVVLAIGNPFGVGQTVTQGIISATGRTQLGISTFENFIQTDAAINPGNSGGALINAHGQLVGINTAIFSRSGGSQGIGFAIPASLAKAVMQQLVEQGRVIRGWLGVNVQDVTPELAESFGLRSTAGAIVAGVLMGGAADQAGLAPGDILLEVDDQPVRDARAAMNIIAAIPPGNEITLKVLRAGSPVEMPVRIGERPKPRRQ